MTDRALCGCMKCVQARSVQMLKDGADFWDTLRGPSFPGWRFACEQCGNKRCPHHSDHTLTCTGSNEPGQPGSWYQ